MPKASPIQTSFSGGEYGPKVYGRVDNERYKQGLDTTINYLPTVQGPLYRRPGLKYVADAKDPSKPPTFIPFKFSATQNYILEFGDYYVRFYSNNGRVLTSGSTYVVTAYQNMYGAIGEPNCYKVFASRASVSPTQPETILTTSAVVQGSILEVPTPYSYDVAQQIKFVQKEDTLWLSCSSIPVMTLQRFSNSLWTLQQFKTKDGPYLPLNTYKNTYDGLNFYLRSTAAPIADPRFVINSGPKLRIDQIAAQSSRIIVTTGSSHPFATGDYVYIAGATGTVEANNSSVVTRESWQVSVYNATSFVLIDSTFSNAYTGSGYVWPAIFRNVAKAEDVGRPIAFQRDSQRYYGYIVNGFNSSSPATSFVGTDPITPTPASATVVLDQDFYNTNYSIAFNITSTFTTWYLGVYNSSPVGYPGVVGFHQDRFVLAGVPQYPQRIDLSEIGLYNYFALSENSSLVVTDQNAISYNLASQETNKVKWIKSDSKGLLSGTLASEWNISPSSQNAALKPTDINAGETSGFGSADIDAVKAGNATLYVQGGGRRVREMNFFFQVDTFRSTDLTELSDHITSPGLSRLAIQKEPIPILWALRADGTLLSMTYNRDDTTLKVGWARHQLGGRSDSGGTAPKVKSIAVIPSNDGTYDQLWCATQRYVNGTSVVQIEYLNKYYDEASNIEDSFYVDAGGTYDSPVNISSISPGSAVVTTSSNHGFANGDYVKITKVVGLNSSITDVDGYISSSNLVNYHTFMVGSISLNTFYLQDFNSSFLDARSYSPYVSSGEVRKLVSSISGLTWLKNETVSYLCDGRLEATAVVNSAGVLTLADKAAVVQVGYNYNSDAKTLRADAGSGDGSSIGKFRRVYRAAFMLHNVAEFRVGPSFTRLTPTTEIELFKADISQSDNPIGLFSGVIRESLETSFNYDGQICFRQSGLLPGVIQSLTLMLEENDV